MRTRNRTAIIGLVAIACAAAGCGKDGAEDAATTTSTTPAATTTSSTFPFPPIPGAVQSSDDLIDCGEYDAVSYQGKALPAADQQKLDCFMTASKKPASAELRIVSPMIDQPPVGHILRVYGDGRRESIEITQDGRHGTASCTDFVLTTPIEPECPRK